MWKVCSESYMNSNKIFPTQQRGVKKIIDACSKDDNITKLVIFGNSITSACNPWTEIEVYAVMHEDRQWPSLDVNDVNVIRYTNFTTEDYLMQEINKTGVVVFDRDLLYSRDDLLKYLSTDEVDNLINTLPSILFSSKDVVEDVVSMYKYIRHGMIGDIYESENNESKSCV